MGFSDLPSELQIQIFGYLDRLNLKAVRGVCRKFRDNASPELFKTVIACSRYKALSALQTVSLHPIYQHYVKEIIYDGALFDVHLAKRDQTYHRQAAKYPELAHGFHRQKHERYKRYKELYEEQEEMMNDGSDSVLFATLSRALAWMRNVSTIVYSPGPHHLPIEAKIMRDLLPRGVIDETEFHHPLDAPIVRHGVQYLIGAIYDAQYTGIREFRVDVTSPEEPPGTEFHLSVFDFQDIAHLEAGKYFFGQLQNLTMNLSLRYDERRNIATASVQGLPQLANLAVLLAETNNLENLTLNLMHWRPSAQQMYGHIIHNTGHSRMYSLLGFHSTWDKLRSLRLGGIYATEEEFRNLIMRHKETLTEVEFHLCSLLEGTWANIVDDVVYGTEIPQFSLNHVNETVTGGKPFDQLEQDEMERRQYEGSIMVYGNGQRYFSEPSHKSVYASRIPSSE